MAEVSIDQSKLPGVKEVCRDFAVLEDHTLAHNLQEQEIEHHLASNIQRNRLVQHDLQVAKQLQEEDLKAQAQLLKRYKDLEQQDCEIAQEIQEKLAIEAERRRIQEKKDEDIARLLQEKELQEEKKRKKHIPEFSGADIYGDSYYEDGDQPRSRRARELGSGYSRSCSLQSDRKAVKQRKEKPRRPLENLEEPQELCSSERSRSSCSRDRMREAPQVTSEQCERTQACQERTRRPPLPRISGEVLLSTDSGDWEAKSSRRTRNWEKQSQHRNQLSPKSSQKSGLRCKEAVYGRDPGQGENRERRHRHKTPPFSEREERHHLCNTGMRSRVTKEAVCAPPSRVTHRDQEWYDAEIARKLQEEEILATQEDMRAAQVAQDEEIARLLMAEEKKAYKKAKEREKTSVDKKHDPECKSKTAKPAHSKSKESSEAHRWRTDRPARPPPGAQMEAEDLNGPHFTNQHSSSRHCAKSESSHKGFHYKQ